MKDIARIILETHLDDLFARVLYESLAIFEASSINKAFLLKEAGSPDALKAAKDSVNDAWESAHMDGVIKGGNLLQKLFNFLFLMEIRKPGFTNEEMLHKIHDLAIHGSLEQRFLSKVTSDTVPDEASAILDDASAGAEQAAKPYPSLTKEEEKVWNRVKVYHEFPDGFKWVYAVDAGGRIAPNMPSSITSKTMHHCGNSPRAGSDDQYWELRDASGKAYLTVILTPAGKIEESKSWGNQENKYRRQIQPYVKWFLKDQKVTGVGHRYDYGYAPQMNFGVKDFIGDDPEFIDYVIENKSELLGNTESRILFWQDAIKEGVLTTEDLKNAYFERASVRELMEKVPQLKEYAERARFHLSADRFSSEDSIFGRNPFVVICAACSGNPFTPEEIDRLVSEGTLSLEEFANYDVHLLTPEIQRVFVKHDARNFDTLCRIGEQVAAFKVSPELWMSLLPDDDEPLSSDMLGRSMRLLDYVYSANPPSKVKTEAETMMSNGKFIDMASDIVRGGTPETREKYGWGAPQPLTLLEKLSVVFERFPELAIPEKLMDCMCYLIQDTHNSSGPSEGFSNNMSILRDVERIGQPRNERLLALYTDDRIAEKFFGTSDISGRERIDYADMKECLYTLIKVFGKTRILNIASRIPDFEMLQGALFVLTGSANQITESMLGMVTECIEEWDLHEWLSLATLPKAMMVSDLVVNFPSTLNALDWDKPDTYNGISQVASKICSPIFAETGLSADKVNVFIDRVCNEAIDHIDVSYIGWVMAGRYSGGLNRTLMTLMISYSVKPDGAERLYRAMGDLMLGNFGQTKMGYDTSWFSIPGAWSIFTIGYDEWEEYYGRYGFRFVNAYVLSAPSDRFVEDDFIVNFVCKKLQDNVPETDIRAFTNIIDGYESRAKKAKLGAVISDAVVDGNFDATETVFMYLYKDRFINAKAYRTYLSRRDDQGAMEVKDLSMAAGVVQSMRSIAKLHTLPQLVTSTVRYLVGRLYDNMGDGSGMYMKVDINCIDDCDVLEQLIDQLTRKATVGYIPAAIMALYSEGLVDKMRDFEQANLQACDVPGKPKAKLKCIVSQKLKSMVGILERVKDRAQDAAAKIAEKKPRKPRKAAARA